jgi:hypothetical protein
VDADGDGTSDVVALTDTRQPGQFNTLNARRSDGTTSLWSRNVPDTSSETFAGDVIPLAGPGGVRFSVITGNSGDGNSRAYVFSGRGDRLFATPPTRFAGSGLGYLSAYDITGDGREDFMFEQAAVLYLFNGATGALLGQGLATYPQMNLVVSGRAGAVQFISSGAFSRVEGVRLDRDAMGGYTPVPAWGLPEASYPAGSTLNCFGAVVQCPDGLRYAQALSTTPRVVVANATTGAVIYDVALAQGRAYANEMELRAAVPSPGLLTNVNATQALSATGGAMAPAFVLGSNEGYLYALDACTPGPSVRWSMNFRAPVGEPIFSDTDGDGADEIVVTSADGFLHGIDTERFPAPSFVYDTDPPRVPSMDVDERTGSSLEATWAPVMGAVAYEWALFTATGSPVSRGARPEDGPFIRTMGLTAFWNEGLIDGTRYFFAVRAIGPADASSVETLSNGVRYRRPAAVSDAGPDVAAVDATAADAEASSDVVDDARDAAIPTDAAPSMDASVLADAAAPSDARADASMGSMSGGCGCRVPGGRAVTDGRTALLAAAAGALVRARRRRASGIG